MTSMDAMDFNGFNLQLVKKDEVTVMLAEIISFSKASKWVRSLDLEERRRYLSYKYNSDSLKFAARRYMAKMFLIYTGNIHSQFKYNSYGKPYIEDSSVSVNWSFSTKMIALASSEKYHVGIDIESLVQRFDYSELWEKVVNDKSIPHNQENFFRFWTAREAIAKCSGKGIDDSFFDELSFSNGICTTKNSNFRLEQFNIKDCIISLATAKK